MFVCYTVEQPCGIRIYAAAFVRHAVAMAHAVPLFVFDYAALEICLAELIAAQRCLRAPHSLCVYYAYRCGFLLLSAPAGRFFAALRGAAVRFFARDLFAAARSVIAALIPSRSFSILFILFVPFLYTLFVQMLYIRSYRVLCNAVSPYAAYSSPRIICIFSRSAGEGAGASSPGFISSSNPAVPMPTGCLRICGFIGLDIQKYLTSSAT